MKHQLRLRTSDWQHEDGILSALRMCCWKGDRHEATHPGQMWSHRKLKWKLEAMHQTRSGVLLLMRLPLQSLAPESAISFRVAPS
jgi:hypothetical protein